MAKFKPGVVLHHKDDSAPPQKPGTAAEYHRLRLQGFSEQKPKAQPDNAKPVAKKA